MKFGSSIAFFAVLISCSCATNADAQFTEEELAETIAYDTGYPPEGYYSYVASLVKTLSKLSPAQVEKVFKGKRPMRRASSETASPPPSDTTAGNGNSGTNPNGKGRP